MSKFDKEKVLINFTEMNAQMILSEEGDVKDLEEVLEAEMNGQRRITFVKRIHGRISHLKSRKELNTLIHRIQTGE